MIQTDSKWDLPPPCKHAYDNNYYHHNYCSKQNWYDKNTCHNSSNDSWAQRLTSILRDIRWYSICACGDGFCGNMYHLYVMNQGTSDKDWSCDTIMARPCWMSCTVTLLSSLFRMIR